MLCRNIKSMSCETVSRCERLWSTGQRWAESCFADRTDRECRVPRCSESLSLDRIVRLEYLEVGPYPEVGVYLEVGLYIKVHRTVEVGRESPWDCRCQAGTVQSAELSSCRVWCQPSRVWWPASMFCPEKRLSCVVDSHLCVPHLEVLLSWVHFVVHYFVCNLFVVILWLYVTDGQFSSLWDILIVIYVLWTERHFQNVLFYQWDFCWYCDIVVYTLYRFHCCFMPLLNYY